MVKKLIIALAGLFAFSGFGDMLYWQVDVYADVQNADGSHSSLYSFLAPVAWRDEDVQPINVDAQGQPITDSSGNYVRGNGNQDAIVGARVNVYGADGTWLRTLENVHGTVIDDSWHSPVDIGHPNAERGVGATAASTSLNGVSTDLDEYYQIAILSRNETEWNGNPVLREIAWSAWFSGELLQADGSYSLTATSVDELAAIWVPMQFYTYNPVPIYDYHPAPEPTTLVLMLLGMGVIGLRRKKC